MNYLLGIIFSTSVALSVPTQALSGDTSLDFLQSKSYPPHEVPLRYQSPLIKGGSKKSDPSLSPLVKGESKKSGSGSLPLIRGGLGRGITRTFASLLSTKAEELNTHKTPPVGKFPSQSRSCPQDVETLTTLLVKDIPSYANRVTQRSIRRSRTSNLSNSIILAGRPEFKPLSLGPGLYTSNAGNAITDEPKQVFITTLERQYTANKAVELQQYHWLFLTLTPSGWRLALMYSQIGSYPAKEPPSPPRESSNGVIGQAVRNWLQDCRAGTVRSQF